MKQSARKKLGVVLILLVLVGYSALAVALHLLLLVQLPMWFQLIYFAVVGIGWAIPAGLIIKWMARPDAN
jgi:ABC-type sugar transport system permease subunit